MRLRWRDGLTLTIMNDTKRLELIVEAVRYCQHMSAMGVPASCYARLLRESVYYVWERRDGLSKERRPQFRSTRAVGLHIGKGALIYDHAIPLKLLQEESAPAARCDSSLGPPAAEQLPRRRAHHEGRRSPFEQGGLAGARCRTTGRDPLARYKAVGIELVENPGIERTTQTDSAGRRSRKQRQALSRFRFHDSDGRDIAPKAWLNIWAEQFPSKNYPGYEELIAKHKSFSPADIEHIGRWKDGARAKGKWKPNVATVAYLIWKQAASERPACPNDDQVADFLAGWSERRYTDDYGSGSVEKPFGLSRATTLLHFISGRRFPIFDSRVRRAVSRLLDATVPNTVSWYLESYCPMFLEIAALCGTRTATGGQGALQLRWKSSWALA